MTLLNTLTEDYKTAYKNKDEIKKVTLSFVLGLIKNKQIELQKEPTDEEVLQILKKEFKNLQEEMSFAQKAEKVDTVAELQSKIDVVKAYLPAMLSEEALKGLVQETMAANNITDLKTQRGDLMKALMASPHKASIDGQMLNTILQSL